MLLVFENEQPTLKFSAGREAVFDEGVLVGEKIRATDDGQ
jgi:hypothetical protein